MSKKPTILRDPVAWLDENLIQLIDNPVAKSLSIVLFLISIFFYAVSPRLVDLYLTSDDYLYIGSFIEWFGVPYGLLLALVLVNVWKQFDDTDRSLDREADAILALFNTFRLSKKTELEADVKSRILDYIRHVQENYMIECDDSNRKAAGDKLLDEIRNLVGVLITEREQKVLATELLRLLNELIDDRGDRLSYSKQRMPRPVLVLSLVASVLWLVPFFTLNFSNFYLKFFLVGGVALVVISIISIIIDLDKPFTGTWIVNMESWGEVLSHVQNEA